LASSTSVELYPAVDVQGGRVVRLRQGDARRATAYADDPVAVARQFARAGARWVHFVDLDRAFGRGENRELARRFLADAGVHTQVGGGLRTEEAIDEMLAWGATRAPSWGAGCTRDGSRWPRPWRAARREPRPHAAPGDRARHARPAPVEPGGIARRVRRRDAPGAARRVALDGRTGRRLARRA